jgi:hypothetical protein
LLLLTLAVNACATQATPPTVEVLADSFFSGQAFVDVNNNGYFDSADTPLEGATFLARDDRGAEFGDTTDGKGSAFLTIPGGAKYPVILRMELPVDNTLPLISPAEVVLQSTSGETILFLFSSP